MSTDRHAALTALSAAVPTLARLEQQRPAEDSAADLIEGWEAAESVLRAWIDAPPASAAQSIIRDVRQRELISLAQAHALMEFLAAAERATRVDYRPTAPDMEAARRASAALDDAVRAREVPHPKRDDARPAAASMLASPHNPPAGAGAAAGAAPVDSAGPALRSTRSPVAIALVIGALILGLGAVVVAVVMFVRRGPPREVVQGAKLYAEGRREGARQQFERAVLKYPGLAIPHVYLGRMAREDGDLPRANSELQRAIQLDSTSVAALREYGSFFLATGNADMARRFYTHALNADATDKTAMGFLGCALIRLNRVPEGIRWIERAGDGSWSACVPQVTPMVPGRAGGSSAP